MHPKKKILLLLLTLVSSSAFSGNGDNKMLPEIPSLQTTFLQNEEGTPEKPPRIKQPRRKTFLLHQTCSTKAEVEDFITSRHLRLSLPSMMKTTWTQDQTKIFKTILSLCNTEEARRTLLQSLGLNLNLKHFFPHELARLVKNLSLQKEGDKKSLTVEEFIQKIQALIRPNLVLPPAC